MNETLQSYRIKYDVQCKLQNFFDKEMIVKNCYCELQAKMKLGTYCEKKYGSEFESIKFKSVKCEDNIDIDSVNKMFNMFGKL